MPYCTTDDLKKLITEKELLRLCDDAGTALGLTDLAVAAIINEAIEQADSEIDGYLSGRYKTPLAPAPRIVTGLSARMTMFNLTARRPGNDKEKEKWEKFYDRSLKMLSDISKGVVRIGAEELATADVVKESGSMVVSAPEKMFGGDFINRM